MKKLFLLLMISKLCILNSSVYAQGVAISAGGGTADPSSILDVQANDKGFLAPRMTETERNAISNPVNGLQIYNTTSDCINFYKNGSWYEICGVCTPDPSTASAGPDQSVGTTSVTLAANTPTYGMGTWSIVSGSGGSFGNTVDPTTTFSGPQGSIHTLKWTISNACGATEDEVTITFLGVQKKIFVTNGAWHANLGGSPVATADGRCQTEANNAGLGGTYIAWISTPSQNASSRLNANDQFIRTDGASIASNLTDLLDGIIDNPINLNAAGGTPTALPGNSNNGEGVLTGTDDDGTVTTYTCSNYTSTGCTSPNNLTIGRMIATNYTWSHWATDCCWVENRLYCIQQ